MKLTRSADVLKKREKLNMSDDLVKQAREAADSCKLSTKHMWLVSTMEGEIMESETGPSPKLNVEYYAILYWQERYEKSKKRIEKLEAALRVYADEDHWFGDKFEPIMFPEGECVCCYEHFSDQGEIARKALEGKDD